MNDRLYLSVGFYIKMQAPSSCHRLNPVFNIAYPPVNLGKGALPRSATCWAIHQHSSLFSSLLHQGSWLHDFLFYRNGRGIFFVLVSFWRRF